MFAAFKLIYKVWFYLITEHLSTGKIKAVSLDLSFMFLMFLCLTIFYCFIMCIGLA